MMASLAPSDRYHRSRERLETYFDRTALAQWTALTSDAPVSRIRATVRAGRDRMRATLLSWLPDTMHGLSLLDAGCGTGALAVEAARRGARVVAVDVSAQLIAVARDRAPKDLAIDWQTGDMLSAGLGRFDHIVAMDSLIHYEAEDLMAAARLLAGRADASLLLTFAPATPALRAMKALGGLFPRADRAPAIVPVAHARLRAGLSTARTARIHAGFYASQALEVLPG